jgi:hypothetical protein
MIVVELGRITELAWDCMYGVESHTDRPTRPEIEDRIRSLKTPEYSCVFLLAVTGTSLTIGGDQEHGYLVFLSKDDQFFYVMAPADSRKGIQRIVIGFQPGDYPCRILVPLSTAIQVARTFFLSADRDASFEWTNDDKSVDSADASTT